MVGRAFVQFCLGDDHSGIDVLLDGPCSTS